MPKRKIQSKYQHSVSEITTRKSDEICLFHFIILKSGKKIMAVFRNNTIFV